MWISTEEFMQLIRLLETYQHLIEELGGSPDLCMRCKTRPKVGSKYCRECLPARGVERGQKMKAKKLAAKAAALALKAGRG